MEDNKMPAGNLMEVPFLVELNKYLAPKTGRSISVLSLENSQVYLSDSLSDPQATLELAVAWLKRRQEIQYAFVAGSVGDMMNLPEPIRSMAINGYHKGRSGAAQFILKPGYYMGYASTGTTHGSWNPYDTHIPLLWYGWGIPKGQTHRDIKMTDIAATLCALLHIQMPSGNIGKVITEIIP
jgi:hypothetical protein